MGKKVSQYQNLIILPVKSGMNLPGILFKAIVCEDNSVAMTLYTSELLDPLTILQ